MVYRRLAAVFSDNLVKEVSDFIVFIYLSVKITIKSNSYLTMQPTLRFEQRTLCGLERIDDSIIHLNDHDVLLACCCGIRT